MKLSEQMVSLTKANLPQPTKRLISKVKKELASSASEGKVVQVLKIYSGKNQTRTELTEIVKSFLSKEGFKIKKLKEDYDIHFYKGKNRKPSKRTWYNQLEVSW